MSSFEAAAPLASLAPLPLAPVAPVSLAPLTRAPLRARLLCFLRALIVGFWANMLDFALLALCVRWLHLEAMPSRAIALLLSGIVTFVGSRSFAFRVGGNVPRQAGRFVIAEGLSLLLNLLSFRLCSMAAPSTAPEIVSAVANGLVFIAFSYPVRRVIVFGASTGARG